ncbi:MAG: sugar phosphate nucleotidyltransferase [Solirubrobacteraceae bacterium]
MQALILAGGEATRLRPLTSTVPKPVVPLAGRPFITYMIEWLRGHGVDDVILACGFMADRVRAVLGDGAALGVRLRYVEEPEPLGTGGALKYAHDLLDERFLMLNGDCLTDVDVTAALAQHERTGARLTLGLYPVSDPSAYGLVRCDASGAVTGFLEKPSAEEIDTDLISLGAYVIEREVLDALPPSGTRVSIERDLFPALVGDGLYGYAASGYWLDIGTPERYLQATYDILEREVATEVGRLVATGDGVAWADGERAAAATVHAPALIGAGCRLADGAVVGGRSVLGHGVQLGAGAHVEGSVLLDGVTVGAGSRIAGSIIGAGARIGEHCQLEDRVVLGAGVRLGDRNTLRGGIRLAPDVALPEEAIAC